MLDVLYLIGLGILGQKLTHLQLHAYAVLTRGHRQIHNPFSP